MSKSWPQRKLCSPVMHENRPEVLRLISSSETAPLNSLDDGGQSVLEQCFPGAEPSVERIADFLRFLVGLGVDLNRRNLSTGATVLLSRLQGSVTHPGESFVALLWAGADPGIPDFKGDLPLHAAVAAEYWGPHGNDFRPDVIDALLSRGANLNVRDGGGWLPLHRAVFAARRPDAVRWLLDRGADPNAKTSFSGLSALDLFDVRRARWPGDDPGIQAIESMLVGAGGKRLAVHPFVQSEKRRKAAKTPSPR